MYFNYLYALNDVRSAFLDTTNSVPESQTHRVSQCTLSVRLSDYHFATQTQSKGFLSSSSGEDCKQPHT